MINITIPEFIDLLTLVRQEQAKGWISQESWEPLAIKLSELIALDGERVAECKEFGPQLSLIA